MELRLYLDEDSMDQRLVRALRARGLDVETALEAEMIKQPDKRHLGYAAEAGRVLLSFNVGDFYELHGQYMNEGREHAGIVLATQQRYDVGERMRRLLRLRTNRRGYAESSRVSRVGWRLTGYASCHTSHVHRTT